MALTRFRSSAKLLTAPNERRKFIAQKHEANIFFANPMDLFIQAQFVCPPLEPALLRSSSFNLVACSNFSLWHSSHDRE